MDPIKKYIFIDGVMKLNPAYKAQQANQGQPSTIADPDKALAVVSSTADIDQAIDLHKEETGNPMQLTATTIASAEIIQDPELMEQFHLPPKIDGTSQRVDGSEVLDKLTNIFAKYEVPVGLLNHLLRLLPYKLNFIVDDSGSMTLDSDALMNQASQYIKQKTGPQRLMGTMTRWEEAEDRLHIMMDMLAYIPTENITIHFLNRSDKIVLDHSGKTPEQFAQNAHQQISQLFHKMPSGGTPIYKRLSEAFNQSSGSTMHYLFTDGVPSDSSVEQIKKLVLGRKNPEMNPLTFMSCTDQDNEAEWMKEVDEAAEWTAELDDFEDERREVLNDHGPGFPFSKGFWLIRQLVDAICPNDLDAMDESIPFTKMTLNNLLGRQLNDTEYKYYFDNNPNGKKYLPLYNEFATSKLFAKEILKNHNMLPSFNQNTNHNLTFWQNPQSQVVNPQSHLVIDNAMNNTPKPFGP